MSQRKKSESDLAKLKKIYGVKTDKEVVDIALKYALQAATDENGDVIKKDVSLH